MIAPMTAPFQDMAPPTMIIVSASDDQAEADVERADRAAHHDVHGPGQPAQGAADDEGRQAVPAHVDARGRRQLLVVAHRVDPPAHPAALAEHDQHEDDQRQR